MNLLSNPWFELSRMPERVVRVARTATPFETAEDLERAHQEVGRALDALPRSRLGVLVDLRQAPARNDPEFERLMPGHRRRIFEGFARRAVLVQSAVGKLHVQRHARTDGFPDLKVFTDEAAAFAFARHA